MTVERRTVVHAAAWSIPVIMAAITAPMAAASTPVDPSDLPVSERYVLAVEYGGNHGQGGDVSNEWFLVWFDGIEKPVQMTNPEVMSSGNARLIELAKAAKKNR